MEEKIGFTILGYLYVNDEEDNEIVDLTAKCQKCGEVFDVKSLKINQELVCPKCGQRAIYAEFRAPPIFVFIDTETEKIFRRTYIDNLDTEEDIQKWLKIIFDKKEEEELKEIILSERKEKMNREDKNGV